MWKQHLFKQKSMPAGSYLEEMIEAIRGFNSRTKEYVRDVISSINKNPKHGICSKLQMMSITV
uniref:Uncharacterized protein n=1 Tax=Setaria italica TaxID=4555 RepID=K3YXH7_SETIT